MACFALILLGFFRFIAALPAQGVDGSLQPFRCRAKPLQSRRGRD
jgi:hypothetical protein